MSGDAYIADTGLLLIRLAAGVTMAAHGYLKFFTGERIAGTGRWFESIGMRPGRLHALAAAWANVIAGILLAVGLCTSLAAAGFVAMMVVAGYAVHRHNGFFSMNSGWEYNFILGAVAAGVGITGAGRYSLDYAAGLQHIFSAGPGLVVSVGGGLLAGIAQLAVFYRPGADTDHATAGEYAHQSTR
jgi:putative oxidoreductase